MKIPRDLSGRQLVKVLCARWAYAEVHQVGSHVILQTDLPSRQRITVPAHKTLKIGTLNAILRSVAAHKRVSREELLTSLAKM